MSNANKAGEGIGSAVGGIFKGIHGVGELIRGNINSALDGAGDGVAGRPHGSVQSRDHNDHDGQTVAQKGAAEINQSIDAVQGRKTAHPPVDIVRPTEFPDLAVNSPDLPLPIMSDSESIQTVTHKGFQCEDGTSLDLFTAYRTFGSVDKPAILICSCFGGTINDTLDLVGKGKPVDPDHYFVIVTNLYGGSQSSSPSNQPAPHDGPNFPKTTYKDNVDGQKLLCDHLGVKHLHAMIGFSMAGQIAYHWGILYGAFVDKLVILCSSAETSANNWMFLQGPQAALRNSEDFKDGKYEKGTCVKGMKAWSTVYMPWAYSEEWFKSEAWKSQNQSLNEYVEQNWLAGAPDANDYLCMAHTWEIASIAKHHPSGSLKEALASMKPDCLVMPGETDRYFTVGDSEFEVQHLRKGKLAVIRSCWGHVTGGFGGPEEDTKFIFKEISAFLK